MRWAFFFGFLLAMALPKKVDCGYPGAPDCREGGPWGTTCTKYELEPFGFFLLELAFKRDVGFAYSTDRDCR
ncbi:MAG TPA: hypothetical protein VK427_14825 [Kofleriaceae bacterium]|nr:hypothetical protein [Kofleriaceae bacterium]